MNLMERQTTVARDLIRINAEAFQKLMRLNASGVENYLMLNADYFDRLPKSEGIGGVLTLQQDYLRQFATGVRSDFSERIEIVQSAARDAMHSVRTQWRDGRDDLKEAVEETFDAAQDTAEIAVEKLQTAANSATEQVEDAIDDHLEQIDGIGDVFAEQLREAGIVSIAQLAALDPQLLDDEAHPLHSLKGRMESEGWIEQAREHLAITS